MNDFDNSVKFTDNTCFSKKNMDILTEQFPNLVYFQWYKDIF